MPKSLKRLGTQLNLPNKMEEKDLVKFNNQESDIINSESELSEIRGGSLWTDILEFILGKEESNGNCVCSQ